MLGVLVFRAFEPVQHTSTMSWKRIAVSLLLAISYGIADEVHQSYVPGRFLDKYDMLADAIGAVLAVGVSYFFLKRRLKKQTAI